MLILFCFSFFTSVSRQSTNLPSDCKFCLALCEKWLLSRLCYVILVLFNTFSTQKSVKDLDHSLNISSVLKPFSMTDRSILRYTVQRGESEVFGRTYKTRKSPSSDFSSLRFSPYSLVHKAYIYWYLCQGSLDFFRILVTHIVFLPYSPKIRTLGQSCERNREKQKNKGTILFCILFLQVLTFFPSVQSTCFC